MMLRSSRHPARPACPMKAGSRKPLILLLVSRLSLLSLFKKIVERKPLQRGPTSRARRVATEKRDKRDKRDAAKFFNCLAHPAFSGEAGKAGSAR
jgi:hypothetical protein